MAKQDEDQGILLREYLRGHPVTTLKASEFNRALEDGAKQPAGTDRARRSVVSDALSVLRAAFLPEGYPESVSQDYLSFQVWDTVQALCSYVRGMLTSQAILRGVGVGQQASTPLAAVFTFFVRDLAGMLGGILFAYLEGSSFDSCAKQWRLFADITNDVGMTVELASPLFPRAMFLPLACLGSIARSVTGVAGGATRAALTQHFARCGNAADVSAKEQSQETATTILGMVAGMLVTRMLAAADTDTLGAHHAQDPTGAGSPGGSGGGGSGDPSLRSLVAAWLVFGCLTVLHVWANVRAMRCLVLASLNQPRLELLVGRYLREGVVLRPTEVSGLEDLTPPPFRRLIDLITGASLRRRRVALQFGSRPTAVMQSERGGQRHRGAGGPAAGDQPVAALRQLLTRQGRRRYLLLPTIQIPQGRPPAATAAATAAAMGTAASTATADTSIQVHCIMHRRATPADQLRAFVHAHCLADQLAACGRAPPGGGGPATAGAAAADVAATAAAAAAERGAEEWMAQRYDMLVSELQAAGWHTDRVTLPRPAWTAEWVATEGGEQGRGLHED